MYNSFHLLPPLQDLFLDLLKELSIGLVIAVFFIMKQFKSPIIFDQVGGDSKKLQLHLTKHATYLRKASIKALKSSRRISTRDCLHRRRCHR